jgi:hypothetical protein
MFRLILSAGLLLGAITGLASHAPAQATTVAAAGPFRPGDEVWVRYGYGGGWKKGVVRSRYGGNHYYVDVEGYGRIGFPASALVWRR